LNKILQINRTNAALAALRGKPRRRLLTERGPWKRLEQSSKAVWEPVSAPVAGAKRAAAFTRR
jgi:hypothetical protein